MRPFTKTQFKRDIARGNILEDFGDEWFKKRDWSVLKAKGNCPQYDRVYTKDRTSIWIEYKHDEMSDVTGNYCLEGKTLQVTQAHYLIIGTPKEAWILPIDTARSLYNIFPKRMVGDLPNNWAALVPRNIFEQNNYQRL